MKRSTIIELMVLLVIFLGFSGCIGMRSFPLAARSGDTITLAIGGTAYHETVPGSEITLNDLDITIQQDINQNGVIDANEVFPVTMRYLFRLYPDLTSYSWNFSWNYAGRPAGQSGQWSVVLDLANPETGSPLPLNGNSPATLVVKTNKLKDNFWYGGEGSLSNIPITILPGTGQHHYFNNPNDVSMYDLANLLPLPQLVISFTGGNGVTAAALDIDYDETILTNSDMIKVIQDVSQPDVILNQRIYKDNNGWKMRILLMTNKGTLQPSALRCFIVWNPAYIASGMSVTDSTFNVTSAKFYNETGAEVSGIGVVKTLQYQYQ